MQEDFRSFLNNKCGATAIEYALLASIGAIVIIGALVLTGDELEALYTRVYNALL